MKQTKRIIQTALFVVVLTTIAVFSKQISKEVIENYNQWIAFVDTHTVNGIQPLGI